MNSGLVAVIFSISMCQTDWWFCLSRGLLFGHSSTESTWYSRSQMSVRPSTKSFFDFNEIWHAGRDRWVMNEDMYAVWPDPRSRSRALQSWKSIFKSYLLRHLQWELATDHGFWNYGTISKFWSGRIFDIFLVFMSRDSNLTRSARMYVRPSTKSSFNFNDIYFPQVSSISMKLACRLRSMSDGVWPNPRSKSRSRALQSWKSGHFQKLSPPFTMGSGNWPRIFKLGHNI